LKRTGRDWENSWYKVLLLVWLLYENRRLENLQLPVESGTKRYLIAREPNHQRGNEFIKPVEYKGYFMEANKSRDQGLHDLEKLVKPCSLPFQLQPE
jgi:hypothetical protein